ncbi:hypothetical protein PIB30_077510 [Stylosanthes scabra]|uniref:Uncharacterized protein n=1 Tax=Stylosanthes scabra TaxID=79078 RepID=A0ABU6TQ42_9FABA|nr:hypothetical protein [Stylosanthes scabra]
MKIRQEQFFENMQKAQSQYLEELKSLRTRRDEMVNQQNNFYRQIKREQEKTIKEIEEVKKFQANPNLVEIPPHKIPDFLHSNVANKKDPYFGALKSDLQQGESSHVADETTQNPPNP